MIIDNKLYLNNK